MTDQEALEMEALKADKWVSKWHTRTVSEVPSEWVRCTPNKNIKVFVYCINNKRDKWIWFFNCAQQPTYTTSKEAMDACDAVLLSAGFYLET
jgi:hypothetical protein